LVYIGGSNLGAKYSVRFAGMVRDYEHFLLAMSYHIYRDIRKAGFPLFAAGVNASLIYGFFPAVFIF